MKNRTKLLVHLRRISDLFGNAIRNGPDGTLEGKFAHEHPIFVNYGLGFYLAGCLAYLEGEDGSYSWCKKSTGHSDFDVFATNHPAPPKVSFRRRGITKDSLDALVCIRNAVTHNDGDLSKNHDSNSLAKVVRANTPGISLSGSIVTLEEEFLEFVRLATLAVRNYYDDG